MTAVTLNIEEFSVRRPFLYHLTAATNIPLIRRAGQLKSAAQLFEDAGQPELARIRRRAHTTLAIDGQSVVIRDQAPLHPGNVALGSDWSFEDLVEALNSRVFFWPGNADSPISYGLRHFARYQNEPTAIIRVRLLDIVAANPDRNALVCRYNSGSPRCNAGRASPRSSATFIPISAAPWRSGEVVEVTFAPDVRLPPTAQVATSLADGWTSFV